MYHNNNNNNKNKKGGGMGGGGGGYRLNHKYNKIVVEWLKIQAKPIKKTVINKKDSI